MKILYLSHSEEQCQMSINILEVESLLYNLFNF